MDDIITRMRQEEVELLKKLDAVRGFLRVYGEEPKKSEISPEKTSAAATRGKAAAKNASAEKKIPLDRFSAYGKTIVEAAIDACMDKMDEPIPTRDMVKFIEDRGISIRGKNSANSISALLARSSDLKPNGRKGWTLSDEFLADDSGTDGHNENEPPEGGSETGEVTASPSSSEQKHVRDLLG